LVEVSNRLVIDAIPTLAWTARPGGSAEFFNQRWLGYTGFSAEQALLTEVVNSFTRI